MFFEVQNFEKIHFVNSYEKRLLCNRITLAKGCRKMMKEHLIYPLYSLDAILSNYHLFRSLQHSLTGNVFPKLGLSERIYPRILNQKRLPPTSTTKEMKNCRSYGKSSVDSNGAYFDWQLLIVYFCEITLFKKTWRSRA